MAFDASNDDDDANDTENKRAKSPAQTKHQVAHVVGVVYRDRRCKHFLVLHLAWRMQELSIYLASVAGKYCTRVLIAP